MAEADEQVTRKDARGVVTGDTGEVLGTVREWQHGLVTAVLRALVFVVPVAAAVGSYYDYSRQVYVSIPLYWVAYGLLLVVTFWRRVPYTAKVATVAVLLYSLAILDFVSDGRGGSGRVFLLLLPFAASVFFGTRRGLAAMGLVVVTMVGMGWAFSSGTLVVTEEIGSADLLGWISNTLVLILIGAFMVASHHYLVPRMSRALDEGQRLRAELEGERLKLEGQVRLRTADLTRRNVALQAAAQVARDAASIRDVGRLIEETATLVSDAFDYYHCGIFLIEEGAGRWAVLHAVSSAEGEAMLAAGHRLRLGEGVVGSAAASGEAHVALDVGADRVFFDNPHLPETRSEVALPLRAGTDVIGVLDVQSKKAGAFGADDVGVLQTLADQIALAIENARLVRELEERVAAEQRAYGELTREEWRRLLGSHGPASGRYDPTGMLAEEAAAGYGPGGENRWQEETRRAAKEGRVVTGSTGDVAALAMPVTVRGSEGTRHVIGVLDARKVAGYGPGGARWTEEELGLLQALVDQLGIALDSARIYEEAQRRAAHERALADVTGRVRESLDVDVVLQRAVVAMRQALGVAEVEVRLDTLASAAGDEGTGR